MFRVLGPLSVTTDTGQEEIRGGRIRVLLAVLLLNAGRTVPSSRLMAECWPDVSPASGLNALEAQVKRLRAKLEQWEPHGPGRRRLQTRYRGYLLTVQDGLDLTCFQAMRARGRELLAGDPVSATGVLRDALGLWRGQALQDVDSPSCEAAAVRLEQGRLNVLEDVIGAELTLGRHRDLIDELRELVLLHPLQESFYDHLMIAQCRSGFVGDALNTYRRARQTFLAELGIEPSPLLRRRMEMILHGHPAVSARAHTPMARPPATGTVAPVT